MGNSGVGPAGLEVVAVEIVEGHVSTKVGPGRERSWGGTSAAFTARAAGWKQEDGRLSLPGSKLVWHAHMCTPARTHAHRKRALTCL